MRVLKVIVVAALLAACGAQEPPMTPEQRAEAVVRAYYDASIAEDFGAMYAELTDDAVLRIYVDFKGRRAPYKTRLRFADWPNELDKAEQHLFHGYESRDTRYAISNLAMTGDGATADVVLEEDFRWRGEEATLRGSDRVFLRNVDGSLQISEVQSRVSFPPREKKR